MRTVSELRGAPDLDGGRVHLRWRLPPASDFAPGPALSAIRVVRRDRNFPVAPDDGDAVFDLPVTDRFSDGGLQPETTYYYTVFAVAGSAFHAGPGSRVAVFATGAHGAAERLYDWVPGAVRSLDAPWTEFRLAELERADAALAAALRGLPAPLRAQGPLRRFLAAPGGALDLMRSFADALPDLHDTDRVRPEYLRPLAGFAGWQLDETLPLHAQRSEVRQAPGLYRRVGTVASLRTLVTRYTTWTAQVAESAERLIRTHEPPQLGVFAATESGVRGTDDAALALGFTPATASATGSAGLPAVLVSPQAGPYALRVGMTLSVTVNEHLPVVTRLRAGDFAQLSAATAQELAAVLGRTLGEAVTGATATGALVLQSRTSGTASTVRVDLSDTSVVTLEAAPAGRLAVVPETAARLRLLYTVADPLTAARDEQAARAFGRQAAVRSRPRSAVRLKTFRDGRWGPSVPLPLDASSERGEPAAVRRPDGTIVVAWLVDPGSAAARLRYAVATPIGAAEPARLQGRRHEPFDPRPGMRLVVRGNWPRAEGFEFAAADLPGPGPWTALQVAGVVSARLAGARAVALADGTLALETRARGEDERLALDLPSSTAAAALGLDEAVAVAAGRADEALSWTDALDVPIAGPGRHADLALAGETGGARLLWSSHDGRAWRVLAATFDGTAWTGPEVVADSLGGDREPSGVATPAGRLWAFWAQRQAAPGTENAWALMARDITGPQSGWPAAITVTTPMVIPPPPGTTQPTRTSDREPAPALPSGPVVRLLFSSDRAGGEDIWRVDLDTATGTPAAPQPLTSGPARDRWPAPVPAGAPAAEPWLLLRSDRSVSLSAQASSPAAPVVRRATDPPVPPPDPAPGPLRSVRAVDNGTLRRRAGSTAAVGRDAARNTLHRRFDDLLAYTPQGTLPDQSLDVTDLYTRGTVVLYLTRAVAAAPLTRERFERLQAALPRLIPGNVRVAVVLAPPADVEGVYPPGADLVEELVGDVFPFVDRLDGAPLEDRVMVALPDWALLRAADVATGALARSFDPAAPQTVRNRTFQRDLDPNRGWTDG